MTPLVSTSENLIPVVFAQTTKKPVKFRETGVSTGEMNLFIYLFEYS
jgi:hypothetical protein